MERISKYSLNPLAACFVPLSMKMGNGNTNESFQTVKYENPVAEYFRAKEAVVSTIGNQQTTVTESFGVSMKMLSSIVKENVSDNLTTVANSAPHITLKTMDESIPENLNGDETSDEHLKKTGMKGLDESLIVLDTSQLKQPVLKKFKVKLADQSKLHMKLLFQIRNKLDINLCYWMEVKATINVHFSLLLKSNFCSVSESNGNKITCSNDIEEKVENCNSNWDECLFPSKSGWIMPSDFFGNSLELRDASYVSESDQYGETENIKDEDQQFDVKDEPFTLDHYTSQLEAIIKDICDSVDQSLALSHDEVCEGQTQTEISTGKRPVWETASEKDRSDSIICDDGIHPLLQEDSSVDTDNTDISSIKKFLGEALSFGSIRKNEALSGQSGCIPPCSIWCNNVPPPAKDTYRRFIKKCDSESLFHRKLSDANKQSPRKQFYKRCFSADDTLKSSNYDKVPLQSASSISKERSLLHKDTVDFIKCSTSASLKNRDRKERTSSFFDHLSTKDCYTDENSSDLWSPYYGVDSKWQPLPDCVPSSDLAQKQSYKRVRDMRRQKSIC